MTCRSDFSEAVAAAAPPPSAASEANHRIANSLSLVAAQLRAERRELHDAEAVEALKRAETRLLAISDFHASLYRDGDEPVDFVARLTERLPVIREALGVECGLVVDGVGASAMTNDRAMRLMTVVSELILNATKHGRDGAGRIRVDLDVSRAPDGRLRIVLRDRGAGLPDGFCMTGNGGMGLRVVSTVVQQLGGTIEAETRDGARFTITVAEG